MTVFGTRMFTCAYQLASFFILIGLLSDSPEPACTDSEAWNEVDPSVEDQVFLAKQADQQ